MGTVDRISRLPDGVLGDIVSLLPTKDDARTQVLSSRWRHIWRAAPLNFDGDATHSSTAYTISHILAAHEGPGRRFCPRLDSLDLGRRSYVLDDWLQCPALDGLQELELHFGNRFAACGWSSLPPPPLPPLPASVHRFSSTLRVASFSGCSFSPEGGDADASPLHLPVLEQLSISHATISENSMEALLLAGCPALQSLLLSYNSGCSRLRVVSRTLRSIGVNLGSGDSRLQHLVVEDAPCLERLLLFSGGEAMDISVILAPKLAIVGPLRDDYSRIKFGSTVFQGPRVSFLTMLPSVKILALVNEHLNLDLAINFLRCFPCLQKLYIKTTLTGYKNLWFDEHEDLVSTLDIRVKKVVLLNY